MPLRRHSELRGRRLRIDEALLERFAMSAAGTWFLLHVAPRLDKALIPRTKGRVSSVGVGTVGLVTTTGAKSGERRTQPLVCLDDGEGLLLVGSNYGRPAHPGWSHNLLADPACVVEFRGPPAPYVARLLDGEERAEAWETAVDFYAGYERYRLRCAPREIRVFRLTPAP
jgi:deazaflavin-dependent oxidoreductase (nitroreductase family)